MVKKSKAIATLPDGSKYPCVIVQKKSKTEGGSRKTSSENISDAKLTDTPPKKAARTFKNYTPVEMKMKPDWFDDLKIREEVKKPRPTSIIDGVLYTSRALIEESNSKLKQQKLNTFNLIEPEVFETYDVCKNVSVNYETVPKVYEDVHIGQQRRGFVPQESYENTEQYRNNVSGSSQPIYPPLSEPGNISDYKKTSADNPFRCKSSMSYSREEPESVMINSNSTSSTSTG